MSGFFERIGDEVRRELARFGPEASIGEVVAAWPQAVGEAIAANAWPARLGRDGTLHVAAGSSPWAFELTQLEGTILERLRERLGEVPLARVRFAVGPLPERSAESEKNARTNAPHVTPALRGEGERMAAPIENSELRGLVARAAAASLAAARRGVDDRLV